MSLVSFLGAVELGLAYSLLALGLFISFRILNIPDLTVDGSFVLGAAVSAMLTCAGHPILGVLCALLAGAGAGIVTALLQTKLEIQPILSGILTMTGLYSINLMVMGGKSNVPMLNKTTLFSMAQNLFGDLLYKIILLSLIAGLLLLIYNLFFKTQLGLSIRATGDNEEMVRASSIDTDLAKIVALALANATVALSGAVVAQLQSSADVNMGSGMVVIGLASLIIGEVIIRNKNILTGTLSVVAGSVVYRLLIAFILKTDLPASYLKLISSLIVAAALATPALHKRLKIRKLIKGGKSRAEN